MQLFQIIYSILSYLAICLVHHGHQTEIRVLIKPLFIAYVASIGQCISDFRITFQSLCIKLEGNCARILINKYRFAQLTIAVAASYAEAVVLGHLFLSHISRTPHSNSCQQLL
jgi:hypothetical protein